MKIPAILKAVVNTTETPTDALSVLNECAPLLKATPTELVSRRKDPPVRCRRCDGYTPHLLKPTDYPEYGTDWILYACQVCGSKGYARQDS